jgi:hypothetical protein
VHVWQLVRNVLLLLACSHAILSLQQAIVHPSPFLTRFSFLTSAVTPAPAYQKESVEKESKARKSSCPLPHAVGGRGVGRPPPARGGGGGGPGAPPPPPPTARWRQGGRKKDQVHVEHT